MWSFKTSGLVIVDEQHRFGVAQRLALKRRCGCAPIDDVGHADSAHFGDEFFADLDVSVIDELPPGRTPIKTQAGQQRAPQRSGRAGVWAPAGKGQQAYWVCPLIEESETLQLQTATETQAALQAALPELSIGLVHGRMKAAEKPK